MEKISFHVDRPTFTNEGFGYGEKPFRLTLDYIAFGGRIKVHGERFIPISMRNFLAVRRESLLKKTYVSPTEEQVTWKNREGEHCSSIVDRSWVTFKEASDHYPLLAKFVILP